MTIGEILSKAYGILKCEKIDTYILDSQLLLCKVLNKDKMYLFMNRNQEVDSEEEKVFFKYIDMRKNRMPVKYIIKECEFMGMNFYVDKGVLIPRPDTEILVERAVKEIKNNNYKKICDLCCGSGIIGISIAELIKDKDLNVICSDISNDAQKVTNENINRFRLKDKVKFVKSDLLKFAAEGNYKFDIIVSNPPYIENSVIPTLEDDVKKYEPMIALSGGDDGLEFYRRIIDESTQILNDNGMICFEIGYNQKRKVSALLIENGFKDVICIKDLASFDRVIIGKYRL